LCLGLGFWNKTLDPYLQKLQIDRATLASNQLATVLAAMQRYARGTPNTILVM